MEAVLSTNGRVVIPKALRNLLELKPGDRIEVKEEAGRVILTPRPKRRPGHEPSSGDQREPPVR
ncbi:MAG TPA: AbrB/MazE/SpoVT family DNA-binding domain-containing protein [Terriglobales bacterium]|jgi:AbrB family looped-hinge helix DNA binding protein